MIRLVSGLLAVALCACGTESSNPEYTGEGLPVVNLERALAYPDGPYGQDEGDVLPNWTFTDQDGGAVDLQAIRSSTLARHLVLLPSAEWMAAARSMLTRVGDLQALGRDDIVYVSAVFEDDAGAIATPADAAAWQATHAIDWLVIAEDAGQFRIAWRDDMRAAVLIDLDNMRRLGAADRPAIGNVLWP